MLVIGILISLKIQNKPTKTRSVFFPKRTHKSILTKSKGSQINPLAFAVSADKHIKAGEALTETDQPTKENGDEFFEKTID